MLSRGRVALVALIILLTTGHAAGVAPPDQVQNRPVQASTQAQTTDLTFRVELLATGDARWTVRRNVSLGTEIRKQTFQEFKTRVGDTAGSSTLAAFRTANRRASVATGRPMSITNVSQTARTTGDTGQVILRFTWRNFSRRTGSSLHVDDVFRTERGTWFSSLNADQSLIIVPPANYSLVDASPSGYKVSNGSLRWDGADTRFAPGDLSITYERVSNPRGPISPPVPWPTIGGVVVGLGLIVALVYLVTGREAGLSALIASGADEADAETAPESDPRTDTPTATTEPATEPTDDTEAEPVDAELLSDEERIERLLEENGGRMKQATIVTETGWSNAKVSQLLSAMDEDGRVDKLRIGRENLISFPEEDITEINSDDS